MIMRIPSKDNIQCAINLKGYMLNWTHSYDLLLEVFNKYKNNKDIQIIGFKIELIDKLYYCNLRQDIREIARELLTYDIDLKLDKTAPESLVKKIAEIQISTKRKNYKPVGYVFASKYCHFHRPYRFPIFDSFARKGLSNLTEKKYKPNEYSQFKNDLDKIRESMDFDVSYAIMDTFLWLYGQWETYNLKGEERISNNFRYLIKHHGEMLKNLD